MVWETSSGVRSRMAKTGFDQALNDPLGGAHGGLRAGVKFILLQIDDTHQTAADLSVT